MDTFTMKCTLKDGKERIFHNCTLYKGKIALVCQKGIGEKQYSFNGIDDVEEYYNDYEPYYRPIINTDLFKENGLIEQTAKEILEKDPEGAINNSQIFNCMFTLGENKGGKVCINQTEENKRSQEQKQAEIEKEILQKETPIPFDEGVFGLTISLKLPKSVWNLISGSARYHKGDSEDEELAEDMGCYDYHPFLLKGWFYSVEAVDKLVNSGYAVTYKSHPITTSTDIQAVNKEIRKIRAEEQRQASLRQQEKQEILTVLHRIWDKGTYIEKSEAEEISKLPPLHFEPLNITGANIYGGGSWLYNTDHYLYYVRNNGMDGDDWSLNNFPTAGAGAICIKVEKPDADVEEFIRRANTFK